MYEGKRIAIIIPAYNEEEALGSVLADIDRTLVDQIIVVDNGSTDHTAEVARASGATVVFEERRGYGSACLAGIAGADNPDIYCFLDGDGSDNGNGKSKGHGYGRDKGQGKGHGYGHSK